MHYANESGTPNGVVTRHRGQRAEVRVRARGGAGRGVVASHEMGVAAVSDRMGTYQINDRPRYLHICFNTMTYININIASMALLGLTSTILYSIISNRFEYKLI